MTSSPDGSLLGAAAVRELASHYRVRPTKRLGQNFVIDANVIRKIVRLSDLRADDTVLEVGPGLGSLTLALLAEAPVVAIEIDRYLAEALPKTVARYAPSLTRRLDVINANAMHVADLPRPATVLVANLPYNVAVPVLLHALEVFPDLRHGVVMVQLEVAERLAAPPGSPAYGVPSAKAAWYAALRQHGRVSRTVFWPAPRVDSGLVSFARHAPPVTRASRAEVFACVDAAFAQRRKSLRGALTGWAGGSDAAEAALVAAGVDPSTRGERIDIATFAAIAENRPASESRRSTRARERDG